MRTLALCALAAAAPSALAMTAVIDWSIDADFQPLVNGQQLTDSDGSVFDFGTLFTMETFGNNRGATVFDTSKTGPNVGGPDPDLLAGIGNIVILQTNSSAAQSTPGIFNTPNDSAGGGEFLLNFDRATELVSIDLVDLDAGNRIIVTLTDTSGRTRSYNIPPQWTGEPTTGPLPDGFGTLLLLEASSQPGPLGPLAVFSEDAGYDASQVVSLHLDFEGSGGWGNLRFVGVVPAPSGLGLALAGLAVGARRRR